MEILLFVMIYCHHLNGLKHKKYFPIYLLYVLVKYDLALIKALS